MFEDIAEQVRVPDADRAFDTLDYTGEDIDDQARILEADRLYDSLDYNVSFFSTLQEAVAVLRNMRDPSSSKLFEKIDRISREDNHKWKRSACNQALISIEKTVEKTRHKILENLIRLFSLRDVKYPEHDIPTSSWIKEPIGQDGAPD